MEDNNKKKVHGTDSSHGKHVEAGKKGAEARWGNEPKGKHEDSHGHKGHAGKMEEEE